MVDAWVKYFTCQVCGRDDDEIRKQHNDIMDPIRPESGAWPRATRMAPPTPGTSRTTPSQKLATSRRAFQIATTQDGETAVMIAAKEGNVGCIRVLVQLGAPLNVWDKAGCTALMRAAEYGHAECLVEMLSMGADFNATDKDGQSALMKAAARGKMECVRILATQGNFQAIDKAGRTARDHAEARGHHQVVSELDRLAGSLELVHAESIPCCLDRDGISRRAGDSTSGTQKALIGDFSAVTSDLNLSTIQGTPLSAVCLATRTRDVSRSVEDSAPLVSISGEEFRKDFPHGEDVSDKNPTPYQWQRHLSAEARRWD